MPGGLLCSCPDDCAGMGALTSLSKKRKRKMKKGRKKKEMLTQLSTPTSSAKPTSLYITTTRK
jgi:hypothetical protein